MNNKVRACASPWRRRLRAWHRFFGIAASLFVLILAVTGLLLNHTERLQLDQRFVRADVLLSWYGIEVPHPPVSYQAGAHWISQIGERLYFDAREVAQLQAGMIGAATFSGGIVVALPGRLLLLNDSGQLIEALGQEHGVPVTIRAVAGGDGLVLDTTQGMFKADDALSNWRRAGTGRYRWSRIANAPPGVQAEVIERYRGEGLSWERVVRDLHSGHLLGRWGFMVMDGAAMVLLLLAGSGLWLWVRGRSAKAERG